MHMLRTSSSVRALHRNYLLRLACQHHRQPYLSSSSCYKQSCFNNNLANLHITRAVSKVSAGSMNSASSILPDEDELESLFAGAMPKEEIGALRFLKEYPQYDGRGVVIAIFDTGVDPGAAGLQITSDGKPKILDVVDCSGSGDVDTSKVVKADSEGHVQGASGRKLRVNPSWSNPTGDWRVGLKYLYDLFPRSLTSRVKEERRKRWEEQQRLALAAAAASLAKLEKGGPASAGSEAAKERAEAEARLTYLKEAAKSYEDFGPIIDCVVWHDGVHWRAALDTIELHQLRPSTTSIAGSSSAVAEEDKVQAGAGAGAPGGSLELFEPMTDFRVERKYGTFSAVDSCNFAINIYDEGATLSIVVDCGAHGTHVAGITAAYFPEDPSMNGIAPGAQIISCKIGDTRLGSMETGTGLTRALIAVLQHKAHLINMSYGEPTSAPNSGRFIDLATELVNKHGVIFVASAGNAGPALSTVGAPGGSCSALFGIGAYVSPDLASAGHSIREKPAAGTQYTWSSRGPTADGHVGVAFSAPGGAIAPVPTWTLQKRQLMNGTSMSSPNACGGIALLLSGIMQAQGGASPSPAQVRQALEETCVPLGGEAADAVLTYGRGLIQVDSAFTYLQRLLTLHTSRPDVRYELSVAVAEGSGRKGRGIYMRQAHESGRPASYTVTVTPCLHEDAPNTARLSVEDRVLLQVEGAGGSYPPSWVSCPSTLLLHHSARTFEVHVDASGLPAGLHYAEVVGYDGGEQWQRPLFRLPVTVVRPLKVPTMLQPGGTLPDVQLGPLSFSPGTEHRMFIDVPEGATWAELVLRAGPHDTPKVFLIRATQLHPGKSYRDTEMRTQVTMSGSSEYVTPMSVIGGATLELTLAQFWSSLGDSTLSAELAFHGVGISSSSSGCGVVVDGGQGTKPIVVKAPLRNEKVKPEAKLNSVKWSVRPSESQLEPLATPRDTLPDGRVVYRLLLSYKLNVAEAGKYKITLPSINKQIYDGVLEAQMSMIYDANKKLVAVGDAHPEYSALKKGDHTVRLMLRHESQELLEKMKNLAVVMRRKLDSPVSVPVYASARDAVQGNGGAGEVLLRAGDSLPLFVGPLPDDKLPKDVGPGKTLSGKLSLGQLRKGSGGAAPSAISLTYLVPPAAEKPPAAPAATPATSTTAATDKAEGSQQDNGKGVAESAAGSKAAGAAKSSGDKLLSEAVRDAKIKVLKDLKLDGPDGEANTALYSTLLAELLAEHPKHLPLLTEHLKKVDSVPQEKRNTVAGLQAIVAAAEGVVGAIETRELAVCLAVKCSEDTAEDKAARKEAEERKTALLDALHRKCTALLDLEALSAKQEQAAAGSAAAGNPDAFQAAFAELRKWVDTAAEVQYALLHSKAEARAKRYAGALRALDKALGDDSCKPTSRKELTEQRIALLGQAGWAHIAAVERNALHARFPTDYAPF